MASINNTGYTRRFLAVLANHGCVFGCEKVCQDVERRTVTEDESGPIVELGGDHIEVGAAVHGEVGALREVLAQQSVGVLVGRSLPWRMRVAEEDASAAAGFDLLVQRELAALVPGERLSEGR